MLPTITKLLAQTSTYNFNDPTYTTTTTSNVPSSVFWSFFIVYFLIVGVIVLLCVIGMWKIYKKAHKPGWAAIIPIYNIIVLEEVVGRPTWWVILYFIPIINVVVSIINAIDLTKSFGKDTGFALILIIFPYVGYPMLGFGKAQYVGPMAHTPPMNNYTAQPGQAQPVSAPAEFTGSVPPSPEPTQPEPPTRPQQAPQPPEPEPTFPPQSPEPPTEPSTESPTEPNSTDTPTPPQPPTPPTPPTGPLIQ